MRKDKKWLIGEIEGRLNECDIYYNKVIIEVLKDILSLVKEMEECL